MFGNLHKKGIYRGDLLDMSLKTQARAKRLNELETERMEKMNRILNRHQRVNDNILTRIHKRTEDAQKQRKGFQDVLNNEYKFDEFQTMKRRYEYDLQPKHRPHTPRTARKIKIETRVLYSGFDRKWFRPEIDRKVRKTDVNMMQSVLRKVLLEHCEQENNQIFDRKLSNSAFHRDIQRRLQDRKDIKLYRNRPKLNF